ncbi:hypothetical protein KAJ89_02960 [Candidatus Parcubacteria bacterium]|nr:hypothetical protein [Candidatus Parcubacteria bacterium]
MNSLKSFANKILSSPLRLVQRAKGLLGRIFLSRPSTSKKNKKYTEKQLEMDRRLVYNLSKKRIPNFRQLKYIKKYLSPKELWAIRLSFIVIFLSIVSLGVYFYFNNLQVVPVAGGVYSEGLIGSPKYINPLYSTVSDVDNDLSQLVYSSLFKRGPSGELVNDLISEYLISEDNKEYTFNIRSDVKWQDGTMLTADDILFTFAAIKDSQYKSPLKQSFIGVEAERLGDYSFKFILADTYAAFLELLTFGVLPANLWAQIPPETASLAELNLKPVGSGLYQFDELVKDKNGNIVEYSLKANPDYYNTPALVGLKYLFYPDFVEAVAAMNDNSVDGLSYLPLDYREDLLTPKAYHFYKLYLPQLTVIFFNQEHNKTLADKAVRQALIHALDRNDIINNFLAGDAYVVDSPILANSFAYNPEVKKYDYNKAKSEELLASVDWKKFSISAEDISQAEEDINSEEEDIRTKAEITLGMGEGEWRKKDDNYLTISLKTVERNENRDILEAIKKYWEEIGVKTLVEILPMTRIQNEVIRTREFDALFYGQIVGADPDPYAFWHSSQTGENGFNIANFADKVVDELLEDARLSLDQSLRQEKYFEFQNIIAEEVPAIFMYSPIYTYVQAKDLKGFNVTNILFPKDRFANVNEWYIKTGKKLIWPNDGN